MIDFRRMILGRSLASNEVDDTKISNTVGLSVYASDALSSVAYATHAVFLQFAVILGELEAKSNHFSLHQEGIFSLPVLAAIGVVVLLVTLGFSYKQTIMEYPNGGGAYIVGKQNLGPLASHIAGASLLIGYVLTVAVSVSAGISEIMVLNNSIIAKLSNTILSFIAIAFIAIMNLRGIKESGKLFAIPTYGFIICIILLLATGFVRLFLASSPVMPQNTRNIGFYNIYLEFGFVSAIGWFIKIFTSGCTALTGVEAISNGIATFREPASKNASKTLMYMVFLLGFMFLGVTLLVCCYNVQAPVYGGEEGTLLSRLGHAVCVGDSGSMCTAAKVFCHLLQVFTFAILVLAANTAYAGFPQLAAMQARDGYLPKQLASVGDRLVLSNGVIALSVFAGLVIYMFQAKVQDLLAVYAVVVFVGFIISQIGMVVHWYVRRGYGWRLKFVVNGLGALASIIVTTHILIYRCSSPPAWIVLLIVPVLVVIFARTHRHYIWLRSTLAASRTDAFLPSKHHAIVLVSNLHAGVVQALAYARVIAGNRVEALTVDLGSDKLHEESSATQKLRADWKHYGMGIPLRVLPSTYRRIIEPILSEVDKIRLIEPEICLTVILPEVYTDKIWHHIFHNHMALRIQKRLITRPGIIVTTVRVHLPK